MRPWTSTHRQRRWGVLPEPRIAPLPFERGFHVGSADVRDEFDVSHLAERDLKTPDGCQIRIVKQGDVVSGRLGKGDLHVDFLVFLPKAGGRGPENGRTEGARNGRVADPQKPGLIRVYAYPDLWNGLDASSFTSTAPGMDSRSVLYFSAGASIRPGRLP